MITIDIGSMFLITLFLSFLTVGVIRIIAYLKVKKQKKAEAEKLNNNLEFFYSGNFK